MRVSKTSFIYHKDKKHYLVNFLYGRIDEISASLTDSIIQLITKKSFELSEINLNESLIRYLQQRGYFTPYSETEEIRENRKRLSTKWERIKLQSKTVSLLLSHWIGDNWCHLGHKLGEEKKENLGTNRINELLEQARLGEEQKIDLWVDVLKYQTELIKIIDLIDQKYNLNTIWTIVRDQKEESRIIDWVQSLPGNITVCIRNIQNTDQDLIPYSKINTLSPQVIGHNYFLLERFKKIFEKGQVFSCPFIYNTYFINQNGEANFCIAKATGNKICSSRLKPLDMAIGNYEEAQGKTDCNYQFICNVECRERKGVSLTKAGGYTCAQKEIYNKLLNGVIDEMIKESNGKDN